MTTTFVATAFLDPSFGHLGVVTIHTPSTAERAYASAVFDDHIVVAGLAIVPGQTIFEADLYVVKMSLHGSLDSTFDFDGKLTAEIPDLRYIHGISLLSAGEIVIAGTASIPENIDFPALVRYH